MVRIPSLARFSLLPLLAPLAPAQTNPCSPGSAVASYRSEPIAPAFASVLGLPGTATLFVSATDDASAVVPFPVGFAFSHFGLAKTELRVCSNGFVSFSSTSTTAANRVPGDGAAPNDAVFPWHDDLVLVSPTASVDVRFSLVAGAENVVVQWTDVGNFVGAGPPLVGTGAFTFQCVLYASTHATLPNVIEFRYDRTTAPPTMGACQASAAGASTFATSATVGCEDGAADPLTLGVDPLSRGAGHPVFPPCDLRLIPTSFTSVVASASASLVPQEPFCHIEGLAGTVAIPPPCAAACYDDEVSSHSTGSNIVLAPPKPKYDPFDKDHPCSRAMDANGLLLYSPGVFFANFANSIPSFADPEFFAAPFWDDLEGKMTSGMFYRIDGAPGCRVVTFEWHDFGAWSAPGGDCVTAGGSISMQVKVFEGSAGSQPPVCPPLPPLPGDGNRRLEFHYDHAGFVPGPFSASIGGEKGNGSLYFSCVAGNSVAAPPAGMKCVVDQCDYGLLSYYGDATTNAVSPTPACYPRIKTNGVPPIVGNPFGLSVMGGTPGSVSFLLLDVGGALPGFKTPVPCGGIALPFGSVWVGLASTLFVGAPAISAGGPCGGCAKFDLPIPAVPGLVGAILFGQWATFGPAPFGLLVELTDGVKMVIG